jgi:hypothetical protein
LKIKKTKNLENTHFSTTKMRKVRKLTFERNKMQKRKNLQCAMNEEAFNFQLASTKKMQGRKYQSRNPTNTTRNMNKQ